MFRYDFLKGMTTVIVCHGEAIQPPQGRNEGRNEGMTFFL